MSGNKRIIFEGGLKSAYGFSLAFKYFSYDLKFALVIGLCLGIYYAPFPSKKNEVLDLNGSRVVITDLQTIVGQDLAFRYAQLGCKLLLINDVQANFHVETIAQKCRQLGAKEVFVLTTNSKDGLAFDKLSQFIEENFDNQINHLILNTLNGSDVQRGLLKNELEDLLEFQTSTFFDQIRYVSELLKYLKRGNGKIVVLAKNADKSVAQYSTITIKETFFLQLNNILLEDRNSKVSVTITMLKNEEQLTGLRGAAVLVTGGSMGIGEHIAYEFAKNGARIIITARSEEKLKEVVVKCKQLGASQVYYFMADMANANHINNLVEFTKQKFRDRLDYLVLNHIMQNKAKFCPTNDIVNELENIRKLYDVNFFAYVHLASRLLPILEHNKGHLTIVSSVAAKHSFPFFVPYASSKSAAEAYFTGLRQELAMNSSKVSVTFAVLGRIDTPGQRNAVDGKFRHHNAFPSESADVTADVIVRGAYHRVREIYHPYWMVWLISKFINLPFAREVFENILQFTMQRSV